MSSTVQQNTESEILARVITPEAPTLSPALAAELLKWGFVDFDRKRMSELASRARLSKQTMTEMIRRLERDGLVERRPDPADGRASRIFLTARSHRFKPVAEAALLELDQLACTRLSARRVDELRRVLGALMELR